MINCCNKTPDQAPGTQATRLLPSVAPTFYESPSMRPRFAAAILAGCTYGNATFAQSAATNNDASEPVVLEVVQQDAAALPMAPASATDNTSAHATSIDPIPFEVVQAPAPAPTPNPAVQTAALMDLFRAIADGNAAKVRTLLASGTGPNGEIPSPPPDDLAARFRGTSLDYVVNVARGVTPLMLAAARGNREIVDELLRAGADTKARTKRHGATALWMAGYFGHVDVMQYLLGITPGSEAARTTIEVDLATQTARVVRDGVPGEAVPISSGRKSFPTPRGEFVITDKHRQWRSTLYHVSMPFFMRLSGRDFGMHAGYLPGYPASHGCIRLQRAHAEEIYSKVPVGTRVVIK